MPSFSTRFKTEIINGLEVFYREAGFTPFWDVLFAHAKDRSANEEAVRKLLQPKTTRWQYTHGVPSARLDGIAPETWRLDQAGIDRRTDPALPAPTSSASRPEDAPCI